LVEIEYIIDISGGKEMTDVKDVDCKYCGSIIPLSKAVKMNPKTGTYKYVCPHCSKMWEK
jgi:DNA-directed RNA polymerase subunit RPC12/RpoP